MKKHRILNYPAIVEACEEGGYFAACPSLPGCHVQGDTLEGTLKELKAVIKAYLADIESTHGRIPNPTQAMITTIPIAI